MPDSSHLSALLQNKLVRVAASKSLSCLCHPSAIFFLFFFFFSSLSLSLSIYIYIYINFIYVYIWSEKNVLKVEFLINKTPSNTDLLPKTTGYHQRLWNICWKFFRSVHALFVLANDLFVLFWVLKKFGRYMLCIFFFFCGYMLCLYMLGIFTCSSHILIYDKKSSDLPFSIQVTLDWDLIFLSLSMIWVFFGMGYFSFCFRFDFLKQFCCLVCVWFIVMVCKIIVLW